MAARIYAESAPPAVRAEMLELVYRHFFNAPNERWPWLAHAAYIARHEMNDPALAARYARAIREHASAASVPRWARDLEIFMLASNDQLEAAQLLLGALIDSGQITDQRELQAMTERLLQLKDRLRGRPDVESRRRPAINEYQLVAMVRPISTRSSCIFFMHAELAK